jgi:hypothetical protein
MKQEEIYHWESIKEMMQRDNMTKEEVIEAGSEIAKQMTDSGYFDAFELLSKAARNKEFWSAFDSEVRAKISDTPEKSYKAFGCEFAMRNTGDRLDYASDPIYAQIQEQLKEREALLKTAFKSKTPIYDEHGAEVPKVPVKTFGKETLIVKF